MSATTGMGGEDGAGLRAALDREALEQAKLRTEALKLQNEALKLAAEREKFFAETLKMQRDHALAPWQMIATAVGATAALFGGAIALVKWADG